jgi:hypothetical protein
MLGSGIYLAAASVYDWSTTPASNSNADPGINWAEGMLPSAVNDSARATMAAIAAFLRDAAVVTGGSGNAFSASYTQPMQAWVPGYFSFVTNRANTGAATFSRDGLSPKPLRGVSGTSLNAGQLVSGALYMASYNQVTDEVLLAGNFGITNANMAQMSAGTVKANISGATANPADVTLAAFFGSAPAGSIPSGAIGSTALSKEVRAFYDSSCPVGWIAADGTGGSPDVRGVVVRGLDAGRGLDSGRTLGSYQADSFASHNHPVTDPGHAHAYTSPASVPVNQGSVPTTLSATSTGAVTGTATTGVGVGNTGGTETRAKNVALLYCYHS